MFSITSKIWQGHSELYATAPLPPQSEVAFKSALVHQADTMFFSSGDTLDFPIFTQVLQQIKLFMPSQPERGECLPTFKKAFTLKHFREKCRLEHRFIHVPRKSVQDLHLTENRTFGHFGATRQGY